MIDRSNGIGQAMSLRHMMDRMFEDAFVVPNQGRNADAWGGLPLDVYEEGDSLVVEAHLPGLSPEAVDVQVERGLLTIQGQTATENEQSGRHYLLREQRTGRFTRTVQLPASYTSDPTEATYQHGVLRLVFPKMEEAKPRRIQVGTGEQTALRNGKASGSEAQLVSH
jgi:HSP20 family protein